MGYYYRLKRNTKSLSAYLLLESLVALWVFSMVVGLFLAATQEARKRKEEILEKEQALQEGHMALQTGYSQMGSVVVERGERVWTLRKGDEILAQIHLLAD